MYPIAQVREPYTSVTYVAQRLPLVELLALKHPLTVATVAKKTKGKRTGDFELESSPISSASHVTSEASLVIKEDFKWTAWDLCDGEHLHNSADHFTQISKKCQMFLYCIAGYFLGQLLPVMTIKPQIVGSPTVV